MALIKNITTNYGVDASYWKIISLDTKFQGNTTITIAGFLNKQARLNYAEPLLSYIHTFNLEDITREDAYNEYKKSNIVDGVEQNIFAGSLDDL